MASADPLTSLAGVSAVGAGTPVDFLTAKRIVTMVAVPSGTITGGQVAMEASQDSVNWVLLSVLEPQQGVNRSIHLSQGAYRYWRSSVTAEVTGGGTVTVTFMEAG